jgi:hypothetical protein
MTLPDLFTLPLDQLETLTKQDLEKHFGPLLPSIRQAIPDMTLGPGNSTPKKQLVKAQQNEMLDMLEQLKANKHLFKTT